jgi:hypothetical protein
MTVKVDDIFIEFDPEETIEINWYDAMTQEQKDIYNRETNYGCW